MHRAPRHHAVIGDGATAAEFAGTTLLERGDTLTIIGPGVGALGRGLAYADVPEDQPWRDAYLLNSPSGVVDPDFADWMVETWPAVVRRMTGRRPDWLGFGQRHIEAGDFAALFAPRAIVGDYLSARSAAMLQDLAARGVTVTRRHALATDLARHGDGFRITLAGGETVVADTVDVATGGPAVQRFGSDAGPTAFTTLYGNEDAIAPLLSRGREIVCLGANAAMLDVLRFAQAVLGDGNVRLTVISASRLMPEPIIWDRPRRAPVMPHLAGPYDSAEAFLEALDSEIARFRAEGATMAVLRPGFKEAINKAGLETLLPSKAQRRKLGDAIERRFRRGTHDSIADFYRLAAVGQIRVIEGRVERVFAPMEGAVEVRLRLADGTLDEMTAPLVINCTGTGDQRAFDLMTTGLIRNGWLRLIEETGGVAVGKGLKTEVPGLRYLSPAVTEIGERVMAFPLYDLMALRTEVRLANGAA